jgi:serine/threonine protein kinase/tetratricopeptide (TPR) repeat protein
MPELWYQAKEILAQALEQRAEERVAFVRKTCGEDAALLAEVESLLLCHDSADTLLENSPAANVLSFQPNLMAGKKIGAYRIVREIGRGGMAVVYLGERDDQNYRKRVAIKMVRPGIGTEQLLQRFRNERQTLAALDHSNIVKLVDGGSTEGGLPYLVMEYVEGIPIDEYSDLHKLSIGARLQLFCNVCSAVEYAHQNLIIHRDLKPGNILITQEGVTRLLDFGIAKLLSPDLFHTALATQTDWHPMTPEYASPEQVQGRSVTKATDIYSLGVLLYELMSGHKPYRSGLQSLLEAERSICEEEAEKPSAAMGRTEDRTVQGGGLSVVTPELVSKNRSLEPRLLRRRLRGDIDTIVLKALRKEPQDRYASAAEFANDIERYLSGNPVAARKPTLTYRGGRFLRRHKESTGTAAILLIMMASLSVWEARRVLRPVAEQHTSNALTSSRSSLAIFGFKNLSDRPDTAWVSTAVSEMLATELGSGEKLRIVPTETVTRTKIDLALPDTESLAADTLAHLRKNLGSDFVVLGSYLDMGNTSRDQVRLDLRLQDTVRGETVAVVSEVSSERELPALVSRAARRLRQQLGVADISQFDATGIRASVPSNPQAMRFYAEGLAKLRAFDALAARDLLLQAVGADPPYPVAHSMLSRAWMALGYNQNAIEEAKKALALAGKLSRTDHALVEARFYEASKDWEKAIETYRALFGFFPDSTEYGLYLANAQVRGERGSEALSTVSKLRGVSEEAKDDPRIDLAEAEAAYSLSDNKRVVLAADNAIKKANFSGAKLLAARARIIQCRAFASLGQSQQSISAGAEARRIFHEAGDLAGEAGALHSMAEVPINQGDLAKAKELYEHALDIARKIGDKHAAARELGNIGLIFVQEGDLATGEKMYAEALANFRDVGDKHGMSVVIGNTGEIRQAEGRLEDAAAEYRDALMLAREVGHRSSEAIDLQLIGDVLADQGELNGAMQMYQQASAIQREINDKSYYASTLYSMGQVKRQRGDIDGAKKISEEALALRQQTGEKGSVAEMKVALGELAVDSGEAALAEKLAREAIPEFQAERETDAELEAQGLLMESLLLQGKLDDRKDAIERRSALYEKSRSVRVRLPFAIKMARAKAAAGDLAGAERLARNVLAEATNSGFVPIQLEASLAIYEIQMKETKPAVVRVQLAELAKNARAKGFERIARMADTTRRASNQ